MIAMRKWAVFTLVGIGLAAVPMGNGPIASQRSSVGRNLDSRNGASKSGLMQRPIKNESILDAPNKMHTRQTHLSNVGDLAKVQSPIVRLHPLLTGKQDVASYSVVRFQIAKRIAQLRKSLPGGNDVSIIKTFNTAIHRIGGRPPNVFNRKSDLNMREVETRVALSI
jgi:hypothetical protein